MSPRALECGMQRCLPMADYLAINALSSSRLDWLAISPLHYQYKLDHPDEAETQSQQRGTAAHTMVLEPYQFPDRYVVEPDPYSVAPDKEKPRATKAYKAAVAELETGGRKVLRADQMRCVRDTNASIRAHAHADRLLDKCPDREVTLVWERDGRLCRARADMLGQGIAGDLKTTRSLKDFSPWTLSREGYYRQASWCVDGLRRLGHDVRHFMFIAVEATPPHDVGVFTMSPADLDIGLMECERLLALLDRCEETGRWPGMFPDVQPAMITEAVVGRITNEEVVS